MLLNVSRVDTWIAAVEDRSGALAEKLEGLAVAGADLEMIIARRTPDRPGHGVIFLTPLVGSRQIDAAAKLGFERSRTMQVIRVGGPDEPGAAFLITRALAAEGINLRGLSAAREGGMFVIHLAFDSAADADKAQARLNQPL